MAKSLGPTSALVLAFLMVFTIVAGITPHATAPLPKNEATDSTGCLQTAAYPDFSFDVLNEPAATVYARPASGIYTRTIRVANGCPGFDVNEVRFLWYPREQRTISLAQPTTPGSFVINAGGGSFDPADVGEPIYCVAWTKPVPPPAPACPIQSGTVITSVGVGGASVTLDNPLGSPCIGPTISGCDYTGVRVGCELTPTLTADPCSDKRLFWDADHSYAPGWTTSADNRAIASREAQRAANGEANQPYIRELVFKATTTEAVRHGAATCGDRQLTDATMDPIGAPTTVNSASGNFATADVGREVSGNGIAPNTVITAKVSSTQITVSQPVTTSYAGPPYATITIGTPPPCSTTVLSDETVNFEDIGVVAGMELHMLTGQASSGEPTHGRYTITSVQAKEIIFSPPMPNTGSIVSGDQYTILPESGLNATLLKGGSLADPALQARAQDFHIAFSVIGGAAGDSIPVQVIGYPAIYPSTGSVPEFETTCIASAAANFRCILPTDITKNNPPIAGCAGTTPTSCLDQSPSVYVALDDVNDLPAPVGMVTRDMDSNGHIDRIDVTFSKRLDPVTFNPNLFSFITKARAPYAPAANTAGSGPVLFCGDNSLAQVDYSGGPNIPPVPGVGIDLPCNQYEVTNGFLTDRPLAPSRSVGTFIVREQPFYDTGDKPYLNYMAPFPGKCPADAPAKCGVRDLGGNTMKQITNADLVAADGSPPVMVGAWGRVGFDTMDLFFSEPVQGAGSQVVASDLVWFDDGGSTATNTPCNAVTAITDFLPGSNVPFDNPSTKGLPATGWHYMLQTKEDVVKNPGRSIKFGACDVHPLSGDAVGPALDASGVPLIRDAGGLPLAFTDKPYVQGLIACPACSVSQISDGSGVNFVTLGIQPGATLKIIDGPGKGTYTVTVVGPGGTTLDFAPSAPFSPTNGDRYTVFNYFNKTWPSGGVEVRKSGFARHITYPLVQRADMDISHDLLRVQFNGPVRYPHGGLNKTDTAVTHADMDIASASGTGQGPQGLLYSYFTAPEVDTIYLRTDHPARPQDVDNSPSFFKVHCNKIQGTNLLDSTTVGTTVGKSSFIPCDDPDRFYGWDSDPAGVQLKPDVAVVDVTPPRISQASTVDSNHDGYIDGVQLLFTEPVNDASFCQGVGGQEPDFCSDADAPLNGMLRFHDPWSPNQYQRETRSKPMWDTSPKGGFRWDTGDVQNDNIGIMQLVNTTYAPNGAAIVKARNFETDYNGGSLPPIDTSKHIASLWTNGLSIFHKQKLASDYLPHLTMQTAGLFRDMTQQPVPNIPANELPEYCELYTTSKFPGFVVPTLNKNGLGACDIYASTKKEVFTVNMLDRAPPVVWKAATVDTPFYDRDHCFAKEKCHTDRQSDPLQAILYGNGTIDGYKLTFSEPVNDFSFCPQEWHVAGYEPASGIHNLTRFRTIEPNDLHGGIRFNDNQITVLFNETIRVNSFSLSGARTASYTSADLDANGLPIPVILNDDGTMISGVTYRAEWPLAGGHKIPVPDTGTRPELTYTASCGGLRDIPGNALLPIDTFSVTEQDGAAPVMVAVGANPGDKQLFLKFSEPVDDGNRGALVRDDFDYQDVSKEGVAGKSSTLEVCHGDGDYIQTGAPDCAPRPLDQAVIPLNDAITDGDRAKDSLSTVVGMVREVAPSVPVGLRQSVADVKVPLSQALDTTPPGGGTFTIKVEDARTDAGSVTLSWIAPGSDGDAGGPVGSYDIRVGNGTAITDFEAHHNPDGIATPAFDPPIFAGPGLTQTVLITGLQPNTTYYFQARAKDPSANPGVVSNQVNTHTTKDSTPPDCLGSGTTVAACPLVITSSDCKKGVPTQRKSCTFSWSSAKDDQSPYSLVYRYKGSDQELDRVLKTDQATKSNSAIWQFPQNGTYWFHVSAYSGGGYTPTAHYKVVIGANTIAVEDIQAANDELQKDVKAVRKQVGDHYVNEVTWTLPPEDTLPGTVVALEIWRKDGNTFVLAARIPGDGTSTYSELQTGNWTDNTVGANADSQYRVQMVFAGNPEQVQPDPQSGYVPLEDQTPSGIPGWAWVLIGIGLALIVAGVVIYFVLRGKQAQQAGSVAYAWESANPDQIGIDEATGLPVHEVRCPSCNNPFQAIGNLPLPVTCPNCGTTGTLD